MQTKEQLRNELKTHHELIYELQDELERKNKEIKELKRQFDDIKDDYKPMTKKDVIDLIMNNLTVSEDGGDYGSSRYLHLDFMGNTIGSVRID